MFRQYARRRLYAKFAKYLASLDFLTDPALIGTNGREGFAMPNAYVQNVLDALQEAVFIVDQNRVVLLTNPAAESIYGNRHLGQDFVRISRNPDCLRAIGQVLNGESRSQSVVYFDTVANATLKLNVVSLGDKNEDGARAVISIRDISDLREAEQMRSDFVANVSHELRSPLTALSGFIETLGLMDKDETEARARFLNLMDSEAQRMIRLIADLLSLSKVESRQRMRPDDQVHVPAILNRVKATLESLATDEGMTIELDVEDGLPSVSASEDELTQVFQNLIENALKYGRRGSQVHVRVFRQPDIAGLIGPGILIEVTDQGEGIAKQHIPRLTERFYRVDTHRSRDKGGTGLGLAIVKHIINRHRGRFLITSEEGVGSRFTVVLPVSYETHS